MSETLVSRAKVCMLRNHNTCMHINVPASLDANDHRPAACTPSLRISVCAFHNGHVTYSPTSGTCMHGSGKFKWASAGVKSSLGLSYFPRSCICSCGALIFSGILEIAEIRKLDNARLTDDMVVHPIYILDQIARRLLTMVLVGIPIAEQNLLVYYHRLCASTGSSFTCPQLSTTKHAWACVH
jgi:hypothetical protein